MVRQGCRTLRFVVHLCLKTGDNAHIFCVSLMGGHGNPPLQFAETLLRVFCPPRVAEGGEILDFDGRIVINIVKDPKLFILQFS